MRRKESHNSQHRPTSGGAFHGEGPQAHDFRAKEKHPAKAEAECLKAMLDMIVNDLGEAGDLSAYESAAGDEHQENDEDLWNEGQCHFLHLRQGLKQGNGQTDDHCSSHGGAGCNNHGPKGFPNKIECINFIHQEIVTPALTSTSVPSSRLATTPSVQIVTDEIVPEISSPLRVAERVLPTRDVDWFT